MSERKFRRIAALLHALTPQDDHGAVLPSVPLGMKMPATLFGKILNNKLAKEDDPVKRSHSL